MSRIAGVRKSAYAMRGTDGALRFYAKYALIYRF